MYDLQAVEPIIEHGAARPRLLRDASSGDDDPILAIDAQVASGDCLITLATSLDEAADLLSSQPEAARPQLEKSIRTLLYLQRRYKLVRTTPNHRQ